MGETERLMQVFLRRRVTETSAIHLLTVHHPKNKALSLMTKPGAILELNRWKRDPEITELSRALLQKVPSKSGSKTVFAELLSKVRIAEYARMGADGIEALCPAVQQGPQQEQQTLPFILRAGISDEALRVVRESWEGSGKQS